MGKQYNAPAHKAGVFTFEDEMINSLISTFKQCDYKAAINVANKLLSEEPKSAFVLKIQGVSYIEIGELDDAIKTLKLSTLYGPKDPETKAALGVAYSRNGELKAAIKQFQLSIDLDNKRSETFNNLGECHYRANNLELARYNLLQSLKLDPKNSNALANLANVQLALNEIESATFYIRKALECNNSTPGFWSNYGNILKGKREFSGAISAYQKSLELQPNSSEVLNNLGIAQLDMGDAIAAQNSFYRAVELSPKSSQAVSNYIFSLNYTDFISNTQLKDITVKLVENCINGENNKHQCKILPNLAQKIRIGFVSADLRNHPVGYFIKGVINKINNDKFEIFCYSNSKVKDQTTIDIIKSCKVYVNISELNDKDAAKLIERDKIEILFDLSGHSGGNRLSLFALKPAPNQITWFGYFGTTGIREIDYMLVDNIVTPAGSDIYYVEKILRMPNSYVCYTPPDFHVEKIDEAPCINNTYITFGSFNNIAKITPNLIRAWATIINSVPMSKLIIKSNQISDNSYCRELLKQFEANNLEASRVIFEGPSPREELLFTYNKIDIALDTFPYAGGTTTWEALWMGVPVVSVTGPSFVSNIGASILKSSHLPELIGNSVAQYISIAQSLATDLDKLQETRNKIRSTIMNSPVFDINLFVSNFESILINLPR